MSHLTTKIRAFVRSIDPLYRLVNNAAPLARAAWPSAPHWVIVLWEDLITAVIRQIYDEGLIATIKDLSSYRLCLADVCFSLAGDLNSSYKNYRWHKPAQDWTGWRDRPGPWKEYLAELRAEDERKMETIVIQPLTDEESRELDDFIIDFAQKRGLSVPGPKVSEVIAA